MQGNAQGGRDLAMASPAPIVLFVFNRPRHTQQTIESLKRNRLAAESELFVFSDGSRDKKDEADVAAVRALIRAVEGFRNVTIHERALNRGLAGSVIEGVSQVIQRYGKVVVVEDDLQFSPHFLAYMNEALVRYEDEPRIFSIGGYSPPLKVPSGFGEDSYLSYRCCTWGWATWRDRWERVDWEVRDFEAFCKDQAMINRFNRGGDDMFQILKLQKAGKLSSWGIRWDYAHFKNDAYCFRPVFSIVANTGNDGSGVHCVPTDKFDVAINTQPTFAFPEPHRLQVDDEINRRFATFYDGKLRAGDIGQASTADKDSFLRKLMVWGRSRAQR